MTTQRLKAQMLDIQLFVAMLHFVQDQVTLQLDNFCLHSAFILSLLCPAQDDDTALPLQLPLVGPHRRLSKQLTASKEWLECARVEYLKQSSQG